MKEVSVGRDGEELDDLAALLLDGGGEVVAVVVAEGVVGVDHRDLLAEVRRHPGGHGADLALHVGDAGLQRPAVEGAGGDVVALGADEVGDLQLAGAGGGAHDDVGEEGAEDEVHVLASANFSTTSAPRLGSVPSSSKTISTGRPLMPPCSFRTSSAAIAVRSYQRP